MAKAYTKIEWKDHVVDSQTGKVLQQGTPVSASNLNHMEEGIDLAHQKLEGANRQTVPLTHGVQVINGDVNAPVSLQMEGRTLIPLQNTELDAAKFYVLADKKTKLKFSESFSVQGIAKFPGVNAKVQVITRTATFEGKVSGSTLENPHIAGTNYSETLKSPSNIDYPASQAYVEAVSKRDSNTQTNFTLEAGKMVQAPFSFNIVEEIERNVGRIPRNTLAEKIQWIKDNVNKAIFQANAYGTGPSGGKLSAAVYRVSTGAFYIATPVTNTTLTTTGISIGNGFGVSNIEIDNNGFIHYLLFTEASDGVTRAQIYIDYVELQIELKPEVILHAPRIPLYEVPKEEYDNILVTWNEDEVLLRYPSVEGVQHIQNPYVIAEGENLFPPFTEIANVHSSLKITYDSPYDITVESTGSYQVITLTKDILPNTKYYFGLEKNEQLVGNSSREIRVHSVDGTVLKSYYSDSIEIITPSNAKYLTVRLGSGSYTGSSKIRFKNPMLCIGSARSFVSRNPSYMLIEEKLGAIGTFKDTLFEQDGKMMLKKMIEKDRELDGSLVWAWVGNSIYNGYKRFRSYLSNQDFPVGFSHNSIIDSRQVLTKYDGTKLRNSGLKTDVSAAPDLYSVYKDGNNPYLIEISVSNADSGFAQEYEPTNAEMKAYFRGWKVKTSDASNKPTAWKSLVDGKDAPTQTVDYVSNNNAPGYIPYKYSYVLESSIISEVRIEGAISVNGPTQIEVGSGVITREKVTPYGNIGQERQINRLGFNPLSKKADTILSIYKNERKDNSWYFLTDTNLAYGRQRAVISDSNYDPSAEYTVTYVVYDRNQFTTNVLTASANFATNIRTALDDTVKKLEDVKAETSVNSLLLYEVLVRMKAGGI